MKKIMWLAFALWLAACGISSQQLDDDAYLQDQHVIRVVDTDFSKGRLGLEHEVRLQDVEKFHGHLCDGLVVGFLALEEGLKVLYPEGVVDRTNTRIVSKSAPCLSDVAMYLTGGRYQYNTFFVDNQIKG